MPGVRELLDALAARDDVYLALLTGNYESGARLKLEYFDLWRYFRCGAFGDDAPDRNGLLPKALARGRGVRRADVRRRRRGRDRRHAARRRRAPRTSARGRLRVATGGHTSEELRAAGADVVSRSRAIMEDSCLGWGLRK